MAAALAASFGFFLTKAVGRFADWGWLSGDPPTVLLRTAAKAPAIAFIAWTYATITADKASAFLLVAVVLGVATAALASIFNTWSTCTSWMCRSPAPMVSRL